MNIPGFTAQSALTRGAAHRGAIVLEASSAAVVPQACVNLGPCRVCVDFSIFPPKACLSFSCLGFSKSFCVP